MVSWSHRIAMPPKGMTLQTFRTPFHIIGKPARKQPLAALSDLERLKDMKLSEHLKRIILSFFWGSEGETPDSEFTSVRGLLEMSEFDYPGPSFTEVLVPPCAQWDLYKGMRFFVDPQKFRTYGHPLAEICTDPTTSKHEYISHLRWVAEPWSVFRWERA